MGHGGGADIPTAQVEGTGQTPLSPQLFLIPPEGGRAGGNPQRVSKVSGSVVEVPWTGDWVSPAGPHQALESISPLPFTGYVSLGASFHVLCLSFLFLNCKMRAPASG